MQRSFLMSGLVMLAACVVPASARACLPGHEGVATVVRPSGPTHPANGAIVLEGWVLTWHDRFPTLEATVDGVPAALVMDEYLSEWVSDDDAYRVLAVRLVSDPTPGQVVHVTGQPCAGWGRTECPIDLTYTADAPETEALPAVASLTWDWEPVEPWGDEWATDSCGRSPSAGYVSAHVQLPTLTDPTAMLRVWVNPVGTPADRTHTLVIGEMGTPPSDRIDRAFVMGTSQVGNPGDPSRVCVHAQIVTAAARGPVVTECLPCRYGGRWSDSPLCLPPMRSCPPALEVGVPLCDPVTPDAGPASPDAGVFAPDGGAPSSPDAGPRAVRYGCAASPSARDGGGPVWLALGIFALVRRRARRG